MHAVSPKVLHKMSATTLLLTPPRSLSPCSDLEEEAGCRIRVRSVLMRAGTSKGLFFRLEDLPSNRQSWGPLLLAAMGSPDPACRQLDGLGGGQSTLSKVAVVSRSDCPDADVDYLFIQVPIDGSPLDFTGNCGNMLSGVGPFSVDEGLFPITSMRRQTVTVRIRNLNTNKLIRSTFDVKGRAPVETGKLRLDGVSVPGSPIRLDFVNPAGSMTGRLLPTGRVVDVIQLPTTAPSTTGQLFHISCVDAANPFVFVSSEELGLIGGESISTLAATVTSTLMEIRAHAAVLMGLSDSVEAAASVMGTPKIAIVGPPGCYETSAGRVVGSGEADIWVRPYSMGKPHPAIQMTGAVCVGAASSIPNTLVNRYFVESRRSRGESLAGPVVIGHAGGTMAVEGSSRIQGDQVVVECGTVYRTARRLMEGNVLYQLDL